MSEVKKEAPVANKSGVVKKLKATKAASVYQKDWFFSMKERVETLPNGLDTYVGRTFDEQGFEPSGGEAQKIALARALCKDAPVVVLDEPTAAMDPRAEYALYRGFDALVEDRTAVYISHRMSSSRFCDRVAVLDGGCLAECGTHEELMALGGRYAELYALQAQYYVE